VCIWTNDRFGSLDLDFIDMTYARRKEITAALAGLGFESDAKQPRYFVHPDCSWSLEFPTAPLAIGHELIEPGQVAELKTETGTIRLLSSTDSIKDRLLWWYLSGDPQCWEQALDMARNHSVNWPNLRRWHEGEGYSNRFQVFRDAI
tara:strand:- start:10975 stop:11415 length:441 start_codon:yes stop_codon:yes gene_type:complete